MNAGALLAESCNDIRYLLLRYTLPVLLLVCICAGYDQIVCVSVKLQLHHFMVETYFSLSLKTLCLVCGLPGAMSSVIHTGCACCLCTVSTEHLYAVTHCPVHSALCMDSNAMAVFLLAMSLNRHQSGLGAQLCVSTFVHVSALSPTTHTHEANVLNIG